MANLAIQIRTGSHPDHWRSGSEYYFSVGDENSKVSPSELLELLQEVVEDSIYETYGEPRRMKRKETNNDYYQLLASCLKSFITSDKVIDFPVI